MSDQPSRDEILSPGPDDGDWGDVIRRAHRANQRRHVYEVVALTALVVVGVATAYATGHPVIDFGTAKKAPHLDIVSFGSMEVTNHGIMKPGVLPGQAREITVLDANKNKFTFSIAPTKSGGFCVSYGGCISDRRRAAGRISVFSDASAEHGTKTESINGEFIDSSADRLEVSYADGTSEEIPWVWVTAPIDAGFYFSDIPKAHWTRAHRPIAVTLFDRQGEVLAHEPITDMTKMFESGSVDHSLPGYPHLLVPAAAIWEERRQLFDFHFDDGTRIGLWVAPTRRSGVCYWSRQSGGCDEPGSQVEKLSVLDAGFEAMGTTHVTLFGQLFGSVKAHTVRVEARFEDGERVELEPKEGWVVWPIPSRHYPRGHRLEELVAFDAAGKSIASTDDRPFLTAINPSETGVYPCELPESLGYGLKECP